MHLQLLTGNILNKIKFFPIESHCLIKLGERVYWFWSCVDFFVISFPQPLKWTDNWWLNSWSIPTRESFKNRPCKVNKITNCDVTNINVSAFDGDKLTIVPSRHWYHINHIITITQGQGQATTFSWFSVEPIREEWCHIFHHQAQITDWNLYKMLIFHQFWHVSLEFS